MVHGCKVPDRTGIEHRPAIAAQKERIGDFEMETIAGKDRKSGLLVEVERKNKFTVICKITSFKAQDAAPAAIRALKPFKDMVQTIKQRVLSARKFYQSIGYANLILPPLPFWEKGLAENTHGLIRQYFPKGTDFKKNGGRRD